MTTQELLTTGELASMLGTETWRVRRLFEDGTLPEPGRFCGKRAIRRQDIPTVVAMQSRGWLHDTEAVTA